MQLICFISSIAVLIAGSGTYTIRESPCDLSWHCMKDDNISVSAVKSKRLSCVKKTPCSILDYLSSTVNQTRDFYIYLKGIRIKQSSDGSWIEAMLNSYDDSIKLGNKSLHVKFLFDGENGCHEFSISSSLFLNSDHVLLPCLRIRMWRPLTFVLSVELETGEVVSIEAFKYLLKDVVDGEWLGGSVIKSSFDLDDKFIYIHVNASQNLKCPFKYSINVHKSHSYHMCDSKRTPVYHWSSTLNVPLESVKIQRSFFKPYQRYCLSAAFTKQRGSPSVSEVESNNASIELVYPEVFSNIVLFQMSPSQTGASSTELPDYKCEMWNMTFDVRVIERNIIATVALWSEYASCFSSFSMQLYQFSCNQYRGRPTTMKFSLGIKPNQTIVFYNLTAGYYCILVLPFVKGRPEKNWIRNSKGINVLEPAAGNDTVLVQKSETPELTVKVVVAMGALLLFTAFSLWSLSTYLKRNKAKSSKEFSEKKNSLEDVPFLKPAVDKVYLFYSRDDASIRYEVSWLKNFLTEQAKLNVSTLYDEFPRLVAKPRAFIDELLECRCTGEEPPCASDKKFIVVFSEKVLSNMDVWRHAEEKAFGMVLNKIAEEGRKTYCHLFLVAFDESIFVDHRFKRIAPLRGADYTIPKALIRLCEKIGSPVSGEELRRCLERYPLGNRESKYF